MAPTANGVEIVPRQRGPQSRPRVAARALCTPGPEAYRNALEKAIDDMVQAFRTGLGLPEDWTPEVCAKRALESKRPMTALQRVDRLTAPPVVGEHYLVHTVRGAFFGKIGDWPVIGPRHEDLKIFGFGWQHYHLDPRFLASERMRNHAQSGYILTDQIVCPMGQPVRRRRKCRHATLEFIIPYNRNTSPLDVLRSTYAGQQCAHAAGGFICPHRKAPLGSIAPIDGVITCPLHGLRIDAATGVVLPAGAGDIETVGPAHA